MKLKIYCELDTIFDTRLPIITSITKIEEKQYIYRQDDNFRYIGESVFKMLYFNRDRSALYDAKITLMVREIQDIINKLIFNNKESDVSLYFNIWPYKLLNQEIERYHSFIKSLYPDINIVMINEKPDYTVFSKYLVIIKYDGIGLVDQAFRNNVESLSPDTTLVIPAITNKYVKGLNIEEILKDIMEKYSPLLNISYYDTIYWSYHE